MLFQVIYPFESTIYGDSFKHAIKNFIKLNHNMNVNKMILKDQTKHMEANFNYYKQDGRNKVGINYFPINYTPNMFVPNPNIFVSSNDLGSNVLMNPFDLISPMSPMSPMSPFDYMSPVMPFIPTVVNIPNV